MTSFLSIFEEVKSSINNNKMFSLLLEKEPSDEDIPEEEAEEEEEEENEQPDEETVFYTEEITECFKLFDKNDTGILQAKHLEKALKCLGIFLTPSEFQEVRDDITKDGNVTFEKFFEYTIKKLKECDPIDSLKISFQAFDPDKEGVLPNDRLKRWLMTLGDPLTEKEAKDLIKLGDPGGKGVTVYDDLVMIMLKK